MLRQTEEGHSEFLQTLDFAPGRAVAEALHALRRVACLLLYVELLGLAFDFLGIE